jgi:hypothetical protein
MINPEIKAPELRLREDIEKLKGLHSDKGSAKSMKVNEFVIAKSQRSFYIQNADAYTSEGTEGISISLGHTAQDGQLGHLFLNGDHAHKCNERVLSAASQLIQLVHAKAEGSSNITDEHINEAHANLKLSLAHQLEQEDLIKLRKPLINELSKYFELDAMGYIVKEKQGMSLSEAMKNDPKIETMLANIFYNVSFAGDAAYADDIRTALAGKNIASTQVAKDARDVEGKMVPDHIRPVSITSAKSKINQPKEPEIYGKKKKGPAYIDKWGNAIWKGNKDFRKMIQNKVEDIKFTPAQLADYDRRVDRIRDLHKNGLLIGRVANTAEAKDFMGHRYNITSNDILSTTLWPKEGDPLVMKLFSEYDKDTVGLLLDHTRAGEDNFGLSFSINAGTAGTNAPKGSKFEQHKIDRKADMKTHDVRGANLLEAQHELLDKLSSEVRNGGSVDNLNIALKNDGSGYLVTKADARTEAPSRSPSRFAGASTTQGGTQGGTQVLWNEQTFYRAIERDLFTGLFVKSDSDNFSKELKDLFVLQDRIRRKKGIYVPIFQFKGSTNQLEEIVPDKMLLNITGAKVTPIEGRTSSFTKELAKAGITEDMALEMSNAIGNDKGTIESLFELQLLMFNMKNVMGQITIPDTTNNVTSFKPVRILDNLHLVFPTIHKTKTAQAEHADSFFSDADVKKIKTTPAMEDYFKKTLNHNFERFLGISIKDGAVTFDKKNGELFDQSDLKKSDFAKVLSRAVQSAVLFQIHGADTNQNMIAMVQEIRKTWPNIGMTPGGVDMILGSGELQTILNKNDLKSDALSARLEPSESTNAKIDVPPFPYNLDAINPFDKIALPDKEGVLQFLNQCGINNNGSINKNLFSEFKASDPHLFTYETAVLQGVQMLFVLKEDQLAKKIMENIRDQCPAFGFTAAGADRSSPQSDQLMRWLQEEVTQMPHTTEFPFGGKAETNASTTPSTAAVGRGGRFVSQPVTQPVPMGRGSATVTTSTNIVNEPTIDDKELQKAAAALIPKFSRDQLRVATKLGLVDVNNNPLWLIEPEFHNGDKGKPTVPYISVKDILGHHIANLLTGPALKQSLLLNDRLSFKIAIDPNIIKKKDVEHLVTDTLAVTTEGDKQVLRPNGLQFSQAVTVPSGGNIQFNGGNEKHRFRSNDARKFHELAYQGKGTYTDDDLKQVEAVDKQLLSDTERRLKRAGMITSSYVTVTAEGGYGSLRKPLDTLHRVLYVATAGAQFEKAGSGSFQYKDGRVDENELEATDFIIKKDADQQQKPLFPQYYPNGEIPAHRDVQEADCNKLNDGDFSKDYVTLNDDSLFNRKAFQASSDQYLNNLVIPHILKRTGESPIYLKAVLFGGGFFAQTENGGNLRPEVINTMLNCYVKALESGLIPAGSAIEFPRYGETKDMPAGLLDRLQKTAAEQNVDLVWTPQGTTTDFKKQTSMTGKEIDISKFQKGGHLVVLGAADAMSWNGNEPSSASVEAEFGNNSNLRLVMNWWANPKVLERLKTL